MTVFVPYVALSAMMFLDLCIKMPSAFIGFFSIEKLFVVSMMAQSQKNGQNKSDKENENLWRLKTYSCVSDTNVFLRLKSHRSELKEVGVQPEGSELEDFSQIKW